MRKLLNFALFQAGWFACVLGAAHGTPWAGAAAAVAICAVHLAFVAKDRAGELRLLAAMTVAGSALSAFNVANGAVVFAPGVVALLGVPLWLAGLWTLFATLLRHSLGWMHGRPAVAAACGLVGSPLSYAGAERLGAVEVHDAFVRGPLVLGLTWAVAVPAAVWLAGRTATDAAARPPAR